MTPGFLGPGKLGFHDYIVTKYTVAFQGVPGTWVPIDLAYRHSGAQAPRCAIYPMLSNNASGLEIGLPAQISAGFYSGKSQNRSSGRPSAGRRADFDAFPTGIRPKSNLEARFPARKHYSVA